MLEFWFEPDTWSRTAAWILLRLVFLTSPLLVDPITSNTIYRKKGKPAEVKKLRKDLDKLVADYEKEHREDKEKKDKKDKKGNLNLTRLLVAQSLNLYSESKISEWLWILYSRYHE